MWVLGSSELLIANVVIHEMLLAKFAYDLVNVGWDGNKWKDVATIDKSMLPFYYKIIINVIMIVKSLTINILLIGMCILFLMDWLRMIITNTQNHIMII